MVLGCRYGVILAEQTPSAWQSVLCSDCHPSASAVPAAESTVATALGSACPVPPASTARLQVNR